MKSTNPNRGDTQSVGQDPSNQHLAPSGRVTPRSHRSIDMRDNAHFAECTLSARRRAGCRTRTVMAVIL